MPANPLDLNPYAWYRAEESGLSGGVFTATDLSGNNRHATQSTSSKQPQRVFRPDGIYSYAWQFDGVDDFLLAHNDVAAYQHAQTVIALAKLTGASTTRRVWGFGALYSLFANGSQWGYYARSTDTIQNLGGNTAAWTVIAIRQFWAHTGVYFPRYLTVGLLPSVLLERQPDTRNGRPYWYTEFNYEGQSHNAMVAWEDLSNDPEVTDYYWALGINGDVVHGMWQGYTGDSSYYGTYTTWAGCEPDTNTTVGLSESVGARGSLNGGDTTAIWTPKNVMSAPPVLAIGAEGHLGGQAWSGLIAEVQVYNDYLESADIQSLYADYFVPRYFTEPPPEPPSAPRMIVFGRDRLAAGDAAFLLAE